jgi:hypothetical protein
MQWYAGSPHDVSSDVATVAAKLMGRDLAGPPVAYAVILEMTGHCALTKVFPRSSRVMEVTGLWFASSCNTSLTRFPSIFNRTNVTDRFQNDFPL